MLKVVPGSVSQALLQRQATNTCSTTSSWANEVHWNGSNRCVQSCQKIERSACEIHKQSGYGSRIRMFVSIRGCFFFGLLMQQHQSDAMKAFVWHLNTYRTNSFWFALCVCRFSSVCFRVCVYVCMCVHFVVSVSMMDPDLHVVKRNE